MTNPIADNASATDRRCTILLVLITSVAALLRLWQCNESLWLDETHTAWTVAEGFGNITSRAKAGNYGPVYFWLPWLSTRLFGLTEFALRLPSLVAGICLVPVCYFIARDWFRSAALGFLAASLVAIDPHSLFYSLEARPYALVQLLSAVHIWLLIRMLDIHTSDVETPARPITYDGLRTELSVGPDRSNKPKWFEVISFCFVGMLLFQLHFTTGLLFVAEGAIVVIAFLLGKRSESLRAAACLIAIGISCLTALGTIQHVAARRKLWNQFIEREAEFRVLFPWAEYLGSAFVVAILCWLVARLTISKTPNTQSETSEFAWKQLAWTLIWLIVPLSVAFGLTRFDIARLFYRRYSMFSYPALMLLTAGIGVVIPTQRGKAAYSLLLFVAIFSVIGPQRQFAADQRFVRHSHEDWRGATQSLRISAITHRSQAPKPVFVRTGLVEERLAPTKSALVEASEYLLFPVSSIYKLGRRETFALTSTLSTTDLAIEKLAYWDGGWLIVRGRKWFDANQSSIADELGDRLQAIDPTIRALVIKPSIPSNSGNIGGGNLVLAEMTVVRRSE